MEVVTIIDEIRAMGSDRSLPVQGERCKQVLLQMKSTKVQNPRRILRTMPMHVRGNWARLHSHPAVALVLRARAAAAGGV